MTKIAIIGEAWGEAEERERVPFVGASGFELTRMLGEAGISRADCFLTNVFNLRPRANDILALCGGKSDAIPGYPPLAKSRYIRSDFQNELTRLGDELLSVNPNLIIALGNTPLWALMGRTGISKLRGTTDLSTHTVAGFKVLPTYHPAAVLRQWELRPLAVADFIKAERESHSGQLHRTRREIWIEPTLEDLEAFYTKFLERAKCISVDIETSGSLITCIGFAPSPRCALVVPFADARKKGRSYWDSHDAEKAAWLFVRRVLGLPCRKLFQNGLYDIAFLWRSAGITVRNAAEDTMLLHHALQPEMLKGLGFLGSVYGNECAWKSMRKKHTTIKSDE